MKKYLYIQRTHIPIYGGSFVIILTNSLKKLRKRIPDFDREVVFAHSWVVPCDDVYSHVAIFNFDNGEDKINHGTIAHEASHVANHIADIIGIVPDFDNDEATAYLIGYITNRIYSFVDECGKTIHLKKEERSNG
ncbi:MAG: hypothetical protein U9N61_10100 [Euryarchaeota archaeon]|nr:hypothetical protein [Euryarchaeota archaeon]